MNQNKELMYPSKSKYLSTKERSAVVSALLSPLRAPDAVEAYEKIQFLEHSCVIAWRDCDNAFRDWKKAEVLVIESGEILESFNAIATRYAHSIEIENAQEFQDFNQGDEVGSSKKIQRLLADKDAHLAGACHNTLSHFENARYRVETSKEKFASTAKTLSLALTLLDAATAAGTVALKMNGVVIPKKKLTKKALDANKPVATVINASTSTVTPVVEVNLVPVVSTVVIGANAPN